MYSQNDEEKVIQEYFIKHPARHKIFCDIGAFDGIGHSNTRMLFERGWTGVLVEPDQFSFARLQKNYNGVDGIILKQIAVGDVSRGRRIFINIPTDTSIRNGAVFPHIWGLGEFSTCCDDEKARWRELVSDWKKVEVGLMPLSEILPKDTDFLSIDCEGMDFEVLASANLAVPHLPQLIMVEDNGDRHDCRKRCDDLLSRLDYKFIHCNTTNSTWGLM